MEVYLIVTAKLDFFFFFRCHKILSPHCYSSKQVLLQTVKLFSNANSGKLAGGIPIKLNLDMHKLLVGSEWGLFLFFLCC